MPTHLRLRGLEAARGEPDGRGPWLPNRVTHAFLRARRQAGLPHFRLHDLRHFMATQMASGIPIALVAQRLNHARISTTVNVYTHAIRSGDRPAAETLAALIANPPTEHEERSID